MVRLELSGRRQAEQISSRQGMMTIKQLAAYVNTGWSVTSMP